MTGQKCWADMCVQKTKTLQQSQIYFTEENVAPNT